ncbi:hypothetical protein [Cerasicoccus maritimus]|uniref:hypothetical protein n=1 Tax=Cerasicoccus maritimus TaxID=490089 RepID=UPI002852700A|nr:hypothetical protein [Cerasicoccus maritimus]
MDLGPDFGVFLAVLVVIERLADELAREQGGNVRHRYVFSGHGKKLVELVGPYDGEGLS